MTTVPIGASVRINEDESMVGGCIGFVTSVEGDMSRDAERIPEGHIEVAVNVVDADIGNGVDYRTILHTNDVSEIYC